MSDPNFTGGLPADVHLDFTRGADFEGTAHLWTIKTVAALRAEVERLTRERDEAEVRAGEMRMCVNCGKVRHAGEPKDDLPECTDPETGFAACTWDATPQEAWSYWRDEAHRKHAAARAAEADAAAAREQVRKLREVVGMVSRLTPYPYDGEGDAEATVNRLIDLARAALQGEGER